MCQIDLFAINSECEIGPITVGSGINRAVVFTHNAQVFQELIENDLSFGIENRPVEGYILSGPFMVRLIAWYCQRKACIWCGPSMIVAAMRA